MMGSVGRRGTILAGLVAAATLAAGFTAPAARADYLDRVFARDMVNNVFGAARDAAAADRGARSKNCWQEERRVKSGHGTIIRRVDVCE